MAVRRTIGREGLGTVPVLQIRDEILFDVPEAELPDGGAHLLAR
jgi:hypothetical protein